MLKKTFTLPAITLTLAIAVSGFANQASVLEQATQAMNTAASQSNGKGALLNVLQSNATLKAAVEALIGTSYDGSAMANLKVVSALQKGGATADKVANTIVSLNGIIGSSTTLTAAQQQQINQTLTGLEIAQVSGQAVKVNTNKVMAENGEELKGAAAEAALFASISTKFGPSAGAGFVHAKKLGVLGPDATKCASEDFSHPIAVATTAALFEPMAQANDASSAVKAGFEGAGQELVHQHAVAGNTLGAADAQGRLCAAYAGVQNHCEIVRSGLTACGRASN